MYTHSVHRSLSLILVLVAAVSAAWADTKVRRASPAAHLEVERAVCLRGESHQDVATCLREAGAAYEQAKRGGRDDDESAQFESNRLQRCDRLPENYRRDCIARMQGQGTASGSVAGGGIYRELVTIVIDDRNSAGNN